MNLVVSSEIDIVTQLHTCIHNMKPNKYIISDGNRSVSLTTTAALFVRGGLCALPMQPLVGRLPLG